MAGRFGESVSDADEIVRRAEAVPKNTKATTTWGMRIWNEWSSSRTVTDGSGVVPVTTPLTEISPTDLAYWMGKFVLEVRKRDGKPYPPKSLYALVCCFKRFFEDNGMHGINPLCPSDVAFGDFRATLDAEMKRLHGLGLGTTTKQAQPITPDEEALLWTSRQLGTHSAKSMLNSVYYYNCKVFGLRCIDEHRNLQCSQYMKRLDENGKLYLEYTDFGNKTNRGGLKHRGVENKCVRQYEFPDDPDHCFVNIFEKYLSFLPTREKYFYFRPLPDNGSGVPRFGSQPVGRNMLSKIIPDMCKEAGVQGRKTGHSGKVTCATVLYHAKFDDQLIKERTGHRSLEALHKYKRTSSDQQREVSKALLPSVAKQCNKEDSDDDFEPPKKVPKIEKQVRKDVESKRVSDEIKGMFPQSSLSHCTFNINITGQ